MVRTAVHNILQVIKLRKLACTIYKLTVQIKKLSNIIGIPVTTYVLALTTYTYILCIVFKYSAPLAAPAALGHDACE